MSLTTGSETPDNRSPRKGTVLTKTKEKQNKKLNKEKFNKTKEGIKARVKPEMFVPAKIGLILLSLLLSIVVCLSIKLINTSKEVDSITDQLNISIIQNDQLKKDNEELVENNRVTKDALRESDEKIKELEVQLADKEVGKVETYTQAANRVAVEPIGTSSTTSTTPIGSKKDENGEYYELEMKVTAYCSCAKCCGKYASNQPKDENGKEVVTTASGNTAKEKYTLAAGKFFDFGTKMYIPGVGLCEVQDRGSKVSGNHLDLYFDSHTEALSWGCKNLTVKIYI